MFWYLQNICLWVWVFIASLARKHRTQTRDFFIIASQGGETSIMWGRSVQGAKRIGGETSRGRNVQGANWRGGETSINRPDSPLRLSHWQLTMFYKVEPARLPGALAPEGTVPVGVNSLPIWTMGGLNFEGVDGQHFYHTTSIKLPDSSEG